MMSIADSTLVDNTESITVPPEAIAFEAKCLQSPDQDPSATALACVLALRAYKEADIVIPEAITQRIAQFQLGGSFHSMLIRQILDRLRLNRRAFQEDKVLARFDEERDLVEAGGSSESPFEACGLPRDNEGTPLPQYPASFSNPDHSIRGTYSEVQGVLGCLETKSGLAGIRAEPLAQHYYCTLPGNSPEIRSCFTFQIRVSSNTRANSYKNILKTNNDNDTFDVITKAKKEWIFAGTQQDFVDAKTNKAIPEHIISKVATYCSTDGRAARVTDFSVNPPVTYWHKAFIENYLEEAEAHQDPAETNEGLINDYIAAKAAAEVEGANFLDISEIDIEREDDSLVKPPLCWINNTQAALFQLMLSPALSVFFDREGQRSILREYYGCDVSEIEQKYKDIDSRITSGKKLRMGNFCPDSFDNWNG